LSKRQEAAIIKEWGRIALSDRDKPASKEKKQ